MGLTEGEAADIRARYAAEGVTMHISHNPQDHAEIAPLVVYVQDVVREHPDWLRLVVETVDVRLPEGWAQIHCSHHNGGELRHWHYPYVAPTGGDVRSRDKFHAQIVDFCLARFPAAWLSERVRP